MKHWNNLRKIDLTKKLSFSSTFLEVHFLLGTNLRGISTIFCELIVSEFSEQPTKIITDGEDEIEDEESNEQTAHPWINEVNETIKTLSKLSLFTEDLSFDRLISKSTRLINQWRDKCGYRQ